MRPDEQRRLLELFAAGSQESLTEAQHNELQALLQAAPESRRLWFLYQDLELGLKCLTQIPKDADHLPKGDAIVSMRSGRTDIQPASRFPANEAPSSRAARLARRKPAVAIVALFCLSAVAIFGVQVWNRSPNADPNGGNKFVNDRLAGLIIESPTHGTKLALAEQKGKLIAIHFLLKSECPFCLKLTHDYAVEATSQSEVLHLFLKPDNASEIKVWAKKISKDGLKKPPVIYRDADSQLAKAFSIPDGYQFHGQVVHYPALVLLDDSGKELFRHVGKGNADRIWPGDFTAMLSKVAKTN